MARSVVRFASDSLRSHFCWKAIGLSYGIEERDLWSELVALARFRSGADREARL